MQKVFTSRSLAEADFVKSLLGGEGIDAFLRNEFGAHTVGGGFGAMAFTWPELWVAEEEVAKALIIVAEFKLRREFDVPSPSAE